MSCRRCNGGPVTHRLTSLHLAAAGLWFLRRQLCSTSATESCLREPLQWVDLTGRVRRQGDSLHVPSQHTFMLLWSTNVSSFNGRGWRCIESILHYHPNATVRIFSNEIPVEHFSALSRRGHSIEVRPFTVAALLQGTPAEGWLARLDTWRNGAYFYSHVTDALRLALLYREGGIYLDTDVVLTRSLPLSPRVSGRSGAELPRALRHRRGGRAHRGRRRTTASDAGSGRTLVNALGIESFAQGDPQRPILNGAIMIFEQPGSRYLWNCMHEFAATYNPDLWGWNGPELLTRVHTRCAAAQPGLVQVRAGLIPVDTACYLDASHGGQHRPARLLLRAFSLLSSAAAAHSSRRLRSSTPLVGNMFELTRPLTTCHGRSAMTSPANPLCAPARCSPRHSYRTCVRIACGSA